MTFMTHVCDARCQAKTTLKSYWHELRDHQEYSKKIAMKTGTHTQVPVTMTTPRELAFFGCFLTFFNGGG